MGSCGPFIFIRFDHPTCQALEIKIFPPRNFPILRCKTYLTKDLFICVNINNVEFLKRKETRNTYTCMNCVRPYITASLHFLVSLSFKYSYKKIIHLAMRTRSLHYPVDQFYNNVYSFCIDLVENLRFLIYDLEYID